MLLQQLLYVHFPAEWIQVVVDDVRPFARAKKERSSTLFFFSSSLSWLPLFPFFDGVPLLSLSLFITIYLFFFLIPSISHIYIYRLCNIHKPFLLLMAVGFVLMLRDKRGKEKMRKRSKVFHTVGGVGRICISLRGTSFKCRCAPCPVRTAMRYYNKKNRNKIGGGSEKKETRLTEVLSLYCFSSKFERQYT